ncbi:MAG: hypothetical protein QXG48_04670 [Thermofilaceae archaeon]
MGIKEALGIRGGQILEFEVQRDDTPLKHVEKKESTIKLVQ